MILTCTGGFRRWMPLLIISTLGPAASGCFRHHTIEPGPWRLKIEAGTQNPESKRYSRKPRNVEVLVDWSKSGTDIEDVKLQYVSRTGDNVVTRQMSGTIQAGGGSQAGSEPFKEISVEGSDPDWTLHLWGKVYGPESMGGSAFARSRNYDFDKLYFEGTWTMVRIKPEE